MENSENELFVVGRSVDLIIVAGKLCLVSGVGCGGVSIDGEGV